MRRFRDEIMKPTDYGSSYVDHYYFTTTEILKILVIDQPYLSQKAINMAELLQPAMINMLDGDGRALITQEQMDTVYNFFMELSSFGSYSLKKLINDEFTRLGFLDSYVGQPVSVVLNTVLGDSITTSIENKRKIFQFNFVLKQNFPNPFNPETQIEYTIPQTSNVTLKVYDLLGEEIYTLVNKEQPEGYYELKFDGTNLSSGIYFYRLEAGEYIETKKMILLK